MSIRVEERLAPVFTQVTAGFRWFGEGRSGKNRESFQKSGRNRGEKILWEHKKVGSKLPTVFLRVIFGQKSHFNKRIPFL